jgi:predicted transposase YdaD
LFDLIAQPALEAARYRFTFVELKQTAFRLDGVFQPPAAQPAWSLFFVEVQLQPDPDFGRAILAMLCENHVAEKP